MEKRTQAVCCKNNRITKLTSKDLVNNFLMQCIVDPFELRLIPTLTQVMMAYLLHPAFHCGVAKLPNDTINMIWHL